MNIRQRRNSINKFITLACTVILMYSSNIYAETNWFVHADLSVGDNPILEDSLDSDEFDLGEGASVAVGAEFSRDHYRWKSRVSIGYKFNEQDITVRTNIGAFNVDIEFKEEFRTFPLDFMMVYDMGWVELGLGGTYHLYPRIRQSSSLGTPIADIDLDNQGGIIAQAEFNLFSTVAIGVRYTDISYSFKSTSGGTITSSTLGSVSIAPSDYSSAFLRITF